VIRTTSFSQEEIIDSIVSLYLPDGIELDPTYSKGMFYRSGKHEPMRKSDLFPQVKGCLKANANNLPYADESISSIMFDPPFIVGHTREKPTGIMGNRFHGFGTIAELWTWYDSCLREFSRILKPRGVLIFKCQDTVNAGKQRWSHVFIMNKAEDRGFTCEDLFVLLAKSRIVGHNHGVQRHARKFHSYFLVFVKKKPVQVVRRK